MENHPSDNFSSADLVGKIYAVLPWKAQNRRLKILRLPVPQLSISFSYQYVHGFQIPMSETIVVKVVEGQ